MKKFILIQLLLLSLSCQLMGQDPHFSQYYSAPLYLNPAFAGTGAGHRFIMNYRNQWPSLANGYVSYAFSYDYNLQNLRSGVGILATVDKAGSASLTSSNVGLVYAYKVQLPGDWILTPGLYFGYGSRNIDFNKLVFGDQLQFQDGTPTSDPSLGTLGSTGYFDFGSGILLYNKIFWAGFSVQHLNRPNRSLLGEESIIPLKKSFHAGFKIPLYNGMFKRDRVANIAPSVVYQTQGRFDQLDAGLHFIYQPIMIGLWYRGIPIQQNTKDKISHDALVLVFGLQFNRMEIGYSYDFTVSELSPVSGGAHEVALKYMMDIRFRSKVKRKDKFIPCPTFMD